ncbi:hypothetical protein L484_006672 [Morus notabilis]|uniref:Uncharacterized protein n=1 Tax=Morus notabilis TaxID=981085 RepID=W9RY24_9ROSA|nr:hypothetical protein L484_006672 [Morus notabilis]
MKSPAPQSSSILSRSSLSPVWFSLCRSPFAVCRSPFTVSLFFLSLHSRSSLSPVYTQVLRSPFASLHVCAPFRSPQHEWRFEKKLFDEMPVSGSLLIGTASRDRNCCRSFSSLHHCIVEDTGEVRKYKEEYFYTNVGKSTTVVSVEEQCYSQAIPKTETKLPFGLRPIPMAITISAACFSCDVAILGGKNNSTYSRNVLSQCYASGQCFCFI